MLSLAEGRCPVKVGEGQNSNNSGEQKKRGLQKWLRGSNGDKATL